MVIRGVASLYFESPHRYQQSLLAILGSEYISWAYAYNSIDWLCYDWVHLFLLDQDSVLIVLSCILPRHLNKWELGGRITKFSHMHKVL